MGAISLVLTESWIGYTPSSTATAEFCASQKIKWKYIPEKSPHFGGLWEAAVKSAKTCLRKVADTIRMTYEELATVLCQIEACLNSQPLIPMLAVDCEGVEPLTPGHFLTGKPLTAIPDQEHRVKEITLLKRWHMCQQVTRHFWKWWSSEYPVSLKWYRWHHPKRNPQKGDVVVLREDNAFVNAWPLGRIVEVYPGKDGLVRVVSVKTSQGVYRRPVTNKIAPLLD